MPLAPSPGGVEAAPAEGEPQCSMAEISQKGLYALRRRSASYFVVRMVTGETAALPDGHRWALHLSNGRTHAASETAPPVWCADLLKTSLWKRGCKTLVYGRGLLEGNKDLSMWLDELSLKRTFLKVVLTVNAGSEHTADLDVKVYNLALPRSNASFFWEAKNIANIVSVHVADKARWLRPNLRRTWFAALCTKYGVPESHFIAGSSGVKSEVDVNDIVVHQSSLSTQALLLLTRIWATGAAITNTVKSATAVLEAFSRLLPSGALVEIELPAGDSDRDAASTIRSPELQAALRHTSPLWPHSHCRLWSLARELPKGSEMAQGSVFKGVARAIDLHVGELKPEGAFDLLSACHSTGNPIDPDLRSAMCKKGRDSFEFSAVSKILKARTGVHYSLVDHTEQQKYWLA